MKKYITLAALLVAGAAFANAEFDKSKAQTYTFDFSSNAPYLNGSNGGAINLVDVEINGVATKAMTGTTSYYETGSSLLYDMLSSASGVDGRSVSFNMQIYWAGGSTNWQTFLHVGKKDTGITLGMNNNGSLCFASNNDYALDVIEDATLTEGTWNDVTFSLAGNGTVSIKIGENTYTGNSISEITWDSTPAERTKFSLGVNAPGWPDYALDSNTKVANISVSYIPEPSAFGLLAGLGALALVGTRRRRK